MIFKFDNTKWYCVFYVDAFECSHVIARFRFLFFAKLFCCLLHRSVRFYIEVDNYNFYET